MHFLKRNAHASNLFKNLSIFKLSDKVYPENWTLICKYLIKIYRKILKNCFTFVTASHSHNTRWSNSSCFKIPSHNTKLDERHSVKISAFHAWNYLQKLHVNILFYQLPLTNLRSLKNSILLVITNNVMPCVMYYCTFDFFSSKSFNYFN